jgi:hypothetical protein
MARIKISQQKEYSAHKYRLEPNPIVLEIRDRLMCLGVNLESLMLINYKSINLVKIMAILW